MPQFIVSQRILFINRENPQTPPDITVISAIISTKVLTMKIIEKRSAKPEQHNTTHKAAVPTVCYNGRHGGAYYLKIIPFCIKRMSFLSRDQAHSGEELKRA